MRKFYLYLDGRQIDLNKQPYIFSNVSGLGQAWNNSLSNLGNGAQYLSKREVKGAQIVGTMNYIKTTSSTAYDEYYSFIRSIRRAEKIEIGYSPLSNGQIYRAQVVPSYFTKTESIFDDLLQTPAAFDLLTPWYLFNTGASSAVMEYTIGGGGEKNGFVLRFNTSSVAFTVSDSAGETIASVSVDIPQDHRSEYNGIEYCCLPWDKHITDLDGKNLLGFSDFSADMWFERFESYADIKFTTAHAFTFDNYYIWESV